MREQLLAGCAVLAACGGSGSVTPSASPTMLASPASANLNPGLQYYPSPQPILVTDPSGLGGSITVLNPAPGGVGVTTAITSQTSAAVTLLAVTGGISPSIQVTDARGASVQIAVQLPDCPRPPLVNFAQMLLPAPGSKNIPVTTPAFDFVVGTNIPQNGPFTPGGRMHFVIGAASTLDPTTMLQPATPPPNVPTPAPSPGETFAYLSGKAPQLLPSTRYDVYYYDDACSGDMSVGSFST